MSRGLVLSLIRCWPMDVCTISLAVCLGTCLLMASRSPRAKVSTLTRTVLLYTLTSHCVGSCIFRSGYRLELVHGWHDFAETYRCGCPFSRIHARSCQVLTGHPSCCRPSQISQHGSVCVLSGLLKGFHWDFLGRTPEYCRPGVTFRACDDWLPLRP